MNSATHHALSTSPDQGTFPLNQWMSSAPGMDLLSLGELILPGAHNCGVDLAASYAFAPVRHWTACQNQSFYYQLINGARALDIRLEYNINARVDTYRFHHSGIRSSRTLDNLVTDVARFLHENPDEFIILDFHELQSGNTPFDYQEFQTTLITQLGRRIIPFVNVDLSLNELKRISPLQRIMLAAEWHPNLNDYYFCRKIEHKWSGVGLTSTDRLHAHITEVMKYPPRSVMPWSLSATSYTIAGGPVDIKEYLNKWFNPLNSDWILKSSIVNADFFEESKLVEYCRAANLIKSASTKHS
ncbi:MULTISPECIES: phospholipase [unclassified Pseudomonas]|uniref:phospholipase n=1 Tax=unclassified Pseudomonas TaxID=196821 RepID=UPI002AC91FFA|nr:MULTISPECIES: phospholipase [unclassified Pseudomonas]MEB0045161.1 phospholipase [Pseudomonas sp. Dout3]MEB0096483.1 phospholipase [Pseudomonas sp. DC1.2]WPX61435.1 phospholipase [Pseudomonas sp. DC1.2]